MTDPQMVRRDQVDYLSDTDLILGVVVEGEARAYPHNIGWWHEIVNDRVSGHPVSVTFCPLTGTGLVFDGKRDRRRRMELGVSGLLYNTNLVMFDREDESLYPQIYLTWHVIQRASGSTFAFGHDTFGHGPTQGSPNHVAGCYVATHPVDGNDGVPHLRHPHHDAARAQRCR
jgi:hypothetical protein